MPRTPNVPALVTALGTALLAAACASPQTQPAPTAGAVTIEGTIASIDTQPWTYDGPAVVQVDVPGRGRVLVQLPARWNLCKAPPVEVDGLRTGMRVRAVGQAQEEGSLTVCAEEEHQLIPLG